MAFGTVASGVPNRPNVRKIGVDSAGLQHDNVLGNKMLSLSRRFRPDGTTPKQGPPRFERIFPALAHTPSRRLPWSRAGTRWYTARGHKLRFCTMALRGRREPPSQSDGLGGPSYRFPQIVTALSIAGFARIQPVSGNPSEFLRIQLQSCRGTIEVDCYARA